MDTSALGWILYIGGLTVWAIAGVLSATYLIAFIWLRRRRRPLPEWTERAVLIVGLPVTVFISVSLLAGLALI